MTWIRLDDDFPAHRKVRRLTDSAFRLHVSALCWSGKYLTDGYIAPEDLRYIGVDLNDGTDPYTLERAAKELVDHGLWHDADHPCEACPASQNGWIIHDYLDINPSAADIRHQRAQAAERQRRARDNRRNAESGMIDEATNRMSRRDSGVSHASVTAPVTRESQCPTPTPTPTLQTSFEEIPDAVRTGRSNHPNSAPKRQRAKPSAATDPSFDRWYAAYPRKDAKGGAIKAWPAALAKVGGNVETLVQAAERYRDSSSRKADYTKLPGTWLNQQCWDDQGATPGNGDRQSGNGYQPYRDNERTRADYLGDL